MSQSLRPARPSVPRLRVLGVRPAPFADLYHFLLMRSWSQFFGLVGAAFLVVNAVFAAAYWVAPGAVANAREGSFEDAFYFSVQTLATIGYGGMAPVTRYGHLVVVVEALVGMLSMALTTGVTFAKFARPTARVIFSEKLIIAPRDGVPHLMVRMANARHNAIVEAQLRVVLLVEEKTREGHVMRRSIDVSLVRDRSSVFFMTWTAMHVIDQKSPFFGQNALDALRLRKGELYLSLVGTDGTTGQTVHARSTYKLDDIVMNAQFADVLRVYDDGTREIDYGKFHDIVLLEPPEA